jgi:hypothetical protein
MGTPAGDAGARRTRSASARLCASEPPPRAACLCVPAPRASAQTQARARVGPLNPRVCTAYWSIASRGASAAHAHARCAAALPRAAAAPHALAPPHTCILLWGKQLCGPLLFGVQNLAALRDSVAPNHAIWRFAFAQLMNPELPLQRACRLSGSASASAEGGGGGTGGSHGGDCVHHARDGRHVGRRQALQLCRPCRRQGAAPGEARTRIPPPRRRAQAGLRSCRHSADRVGVVCVRVGSAASAQLAGVDAGCVACQVARCKTREDQDGLLHMELYELLREGMAGNIPTGRRLQCTHGHARAASRCALAPRAHDRCAD